MTSSAKQLIQRCATALAALCLALPLSTWAAFMVNGDGTVSDSETGLVWDRCALGLSDPGCATGAAGTYTWAQALLEVSTRNTANHLGFNDWRLPNIKELESLVNIAVSSPSIDTTAFPNTPAYYFWSATTFAPSPANAWFVNFGYGNSGANVKAYYFHVRLVRSGQSFAAFDLLATAQTLTFGAAPTGVVAGGAPTVSATSATPNSGNAVTYSSTTPSVCTVNASTGVVSAIAVGTCTLAADQAGNASYSAAPQITQSFSVGQGAQTITFGVQAGQTFVSSGTFAISPVATGGASGNAIVYSSTTTGVCTVSGTTVTMVTAGTCTIAANQAGNTNYAVATPVTQNVAIGQAAQTLTFASQSPATQTFVSGGTFAINPAATSATPNSGSPIVYSSTTTGVCTVSGSTVTIVSVGTCTIAANQAGNTNYAAATPVTQNVAIGPAAQVLTFTAAPTGLVVGGTTTVTATRTSPDSGNAVVYASSTNSICTVNPTTGVVSALAVGTCSIIASQAAGGSYAAAAPVTQSFAIAAAPPATASSGPLNTMKPGVTATLSVVGCSAFTSAAFAAAPAPLPASTAFPYGLADFTLTGCAATATITVTYSETLPSGAFYKRQSGAYTVYPATISGTTIVFTLTDNGAGDDNPTAGIIHDPSGLGVNAPVVVTPSIPVPVLPWPLLLLLAGLLLGAARGVVRRENSTTRDAE